MTDRGLEDLADSWMVKIVAMSTVLNQQLHEGIRLGTNIDTSKVRGLTYGMLVSFGSYVIQQRLLSDITEDRKEEFATLMRDKYLSIQSNVTGGNHDEKWLAATKDMYDGPFRKMSVTKGPVTAYLKTALLAVFNSYTGIKFSNFFSMLIPSESGHKVPVKVLDDLVISIWAAYMNLGLDS